MSKKDIEVAIKVLKEHIDENENLLEYESLSKKEMEDIKNESSACCKVIFMLEKMEG